MQRGIRAICRLTTKTDKKPILICNQKNFYSSSNNNNNFFEDRCEPIYKIENIPDDSNIHVAECVEKNKVGKDLYQLKFNKHHKKSTNFNFIPVQWVDMFIPSRKTVGGFSLTSTPTELPYFDLAIQKTPHPPTLWLAENCQIGDVVSVQAGGNFFGQNF